jgi:hypothetical protein
MSKMADLEIDIQTMLEEGVHPSSIARRLEIPVSWVYDSLEYMEEESNTEVYSPFETVNS